MLNRSDKPLVLMSVSTGWVVRNLFQTGVIPALRETCDIRIVTTPVLGSELERRGYASRQELVVRIDLAEPRLWRYLRQIRKTLYMEGRNSTTERIWRTYVRRPFYQRLGGCVIRYLLRLFDASWLSALVESFDFALNRCRPAEAIFEQHRPQAFLATHATTFFEESLLHASDRKRVPSLFMVLSWDHLSSKVILGTRYARVLVWNKVTAQEILASTRAYTEKDILIGGIPQFDIYAHEPAITYAEWCGRYGLDPARRTILFSTMPQSRHGEQDIIIERLAVAIRENERLPDDLQVLIKCHPFDNSEKYDRLLARGYRIGICRSTLSTGNDQEVWFPSAQEMVISRDALHFSAVDINIFSTVTLEAAVLNKPVIHIAYNPTPVVDQIPCREYYKFDHFRPIVESGAAALVESDGELLEALKLALESPGRLADQRRVLVERYFYGALGTAAERTARHLAAFANEPPKIEA